MDEHHFEQAERLASALVDARINKARHKPPRPVDFDDSCACGEDIPPARIELEYFNCVDCQQRIEHNRQLGV